jgi:hypothetical protein
MLKRKITERKSSHGLMFKKETVVSLIVALKEHRDIMTQEGAIGHGVLPIDGLGENSNPSTTGRGVQGNTIGDTPQISRLEDEAIRLLHRRVFRVQSFELRVWRVTEGDEILVPSRREESLADHSTRMRHISLRGCVLRLEHELFRVFFLVIRGDVDSANQISCSLCNRDNQATGSTGMIPGEAQVAKQRHKGIAIRAGAVVFHGRAGREEECGVRGESESSRSREGRRERGGAYRRAQSGRSGGSTWDPGKPR